MNDTVSATPKKMSVKTIAVIGVLTAVTCILAPLSIPIGDVPISLTNLVIYFGLYILGTRRETVSYFYRKVRTETGIGHDRHDSRNCCLLYLWNGMVCTGNENLCTGGVDNVRLSVYCI